VDYERTTSFASHDVPEVAFPFAAFGSLKQTPVFYFRIVLHCNAARCYNVTHATYLKQFRLRTNSQVWRGRKETPRQTMCQVGSQAFGSVQAWASCLGGEETMKEPIIRKRSPETPHAWPYEHGRKEVVVTLALPYRCYRDFLMTCGHNDEAALTKMNLALQEWARTKLW